MDINQRNMSDNTEIMSNNNKMMTISSSLEFFKNTFVEMEKMRDETWSDLTLKVGYQLLFTHRLVLAVHSGYFKTLFLGNFSDSKSKEIDLSSVVDEIDILEKIIKYMYTGELEYEEEDFWEVARLASYFEMKVLMAECQDKMCNQVTLHNSIQYYMFAHSHGYTHIDDITNEVIEPRFHDYFVYQESTLELRPGDMKLMLDWGFFKHCRNAAFLQFLADWVVKGFTNQHVEIANEIVDYLDQKSTSDFTVVAHKTSTESLVESSNKLESKLEESDIEVDKDLGNSFLKKFKKNMIQQIEAEEIPIDDEENVLFALCERKKKEMLLDPNFENKTKENKFYLSKKSVKKDWDSVYDIFLFRNQSNCWYHINTMESRPYWYYDEVLPFERKHCDCFVVDKSLIFVTKCSRRALKFDLLKNQWSKFKLKEVKKDQQISNSWGDFLYDETKDEKLSDIGNHFAVSNNELYVVIVKTDVDIEYRYEDVPSEVTACYFRVCRVDIQNGYMTEVAKTCRQYFKYKFYLADLSRFEVIRSSAHVQINETSGDMLVLVYIDDDLDAQFKKYISFVVNIKDGSSYFFPTEINDQLKYPFHDLYIVEKEDCFLIVHHFDEDYYEIVAEYKFLSKEINFRQGISKPDPAVPEPFLFFDPLPQEEAGLYNGGGSGLWYFNGYWNYTCDFKYLPLEEKRSIVPGDQHIEVNESEDKNDNDNNAEENEEGEKSKAAAVKGDEGEVKEGENSTAHVSEDTNAETDGAINSKGNINEESNVERNVSKEDKVKEVKLADDSVELSDEENEIEQRSFDGIPPPFTNVKCVCEAKMDRVFLSKLKPVNMFLM